MTAMIERLHHSFHHEWHVAINKFHDGKVGTDEWKHWMYEAKSMADEVPRLAILFKMQREKSLPTESDKELMAAATAMMRDLTKRRGGNHGCLLMFEPTWPDNVCVRGHLDLNSLAAAALEAAEKIRKRARRVVP